MTFLDFAAITVCVSVIFLICVKADVGEDIKMCPSVAGLGRSYHLSNTIDKTTFIGIIWTRPGGQYVVTCNPQKVCASTDEYSASVSDNYSNLTIGIVRALDLGAWKITAANNLTLSVSVCNLTAASLPTCSIMADKNTAELEPNTELTLTVNITEYYCPQSHSINITTGSIVERLVTGEHQSSTGNYTTLSSSLTFIMTQSHFGDVTINFHCGISIWDLKCSGVTTLDKHMESPNLLWIIAIVAATLILILVVVFVIRYRDKLKKTYRYIINKKSSKKVDDDKAPMEEKS